MNYITSLICCLRPDVHKKTKSDLGVHHDTVGSCVNIIDAAMSDEDFEDLVAVAGQSAITKYFNYLPDNEDNVLLGTDGPVLSSNKNQTPADILRSNSHHWREFHLNELDFVWHQLTDDKLFVIILFSFLDFLMSFYHCEPINTSWLFHSISMCSCCNWWRREGAQL